MIPKCCRRALVVSCALAALGFAHPSLAAAPQVKVLLPLGRSAYQTNELIDLSVVRTADADLPAGDLSVAVAGEDGSRLAFTFPVAGAKADGKDARMTSHLHLDGRLLRPGNYTIEVAAGDAKAPPVAVDVHSHVRRSDFKIIDWGSRAAKEEQAILGEDGMGFNLIMTAYGGVDRDHLIRGGADYMQNCTMGGAHQIDLVLQNDWSDPYVLQGGAARVTRQALKDRTAPNCVGVHFYDEPGLTWWKHPRTGAFVPFNIPAQDRSYKSAFGTDAPQYDQTKPDDPAAVARWDEMNRWKLGFMEAAWKYSRFGVDRVRADFLSATQTQYAWNAYADGYYFNVARQLPVISGHGGYDDGPGSYFYPSFHLEFGRMRDLNKPVWYLPTWYGMPADVFRLEQYLSFQTGVQGMAVPPDMKVFRPLGDPKDAAVSEGIVESNKLMARLGTVFTHLPPRRGPVAQLYSLSQALGAEVRDMQDPAAVNKAAYEGGKHSRAMTLMTYLAGKQIHVPFFPVVEEDVLDGTLARHHKAVVLPGVDTLDPKVVAALEQFVAGGGAVLVSDDSKVQIKGAMRVGAECDVTQYDLIGRRWEEMSKEADKERQKELQKQAFLARAGGVMVKANEKYAHALKSKLDALGIRPGFDADGEQVITTVQGDDDIEYLFAVNATWDEASGSHLGIKSADATLSTVNDLRPVYDAIHGGVAEGFKPDGDRLKAKLRFGPGQMRVFARTRVPITEVRVLPVALVGDYASDKDPVRIETSAYLVGENHQVLPLSGSAPMRVQLIDPLGQTRYDLYRSTDRGTLRISLPLAANDPAGVWGLHVTDLLSGHENGAPIDYHPPAHAPAVAGATRRAVSFGNDRDNVFRFFRTFRDVTIVKGKSEYNTAAAERLAAALKPWDVRCKIITAEEANQPRELTEEETYAWSGLEGSVNRDRWKDGKHQPFGPATVGFAVRGPVVLMGTPEDNPLIKFALDKQFLPYKPDPADFPGRGRGYFAWQRDAVSYQSESVALIAYDAVGMGEAVGSVYEAAAGLDGLTRFELPRGGNVTPAGKRVQPPEAEVAWRAVVPDRPVFVSGAEGGGLTVYTADGSKTTLDADGKATGTELSPHPPRGPEAKAEVPAELKKALVPFRVVKRVARAGGVAAVGYWGGTVQVIGADGATKSVQVLPSDVSQMSWLNGNLVVALADGTVVAMKAK